MENRCEKTEKRLGYGIMLFAVLFFLTAYKCTAQSKVYREHRYPNEKNIVTFTPYESLEFKIGKDTIYLCVLYDSVGKNKSTVKLYAYYPKTVKIVSKIIIGFDGGTNNTFTASKFNLSGKRENYIEYVSTKPDYYSLIGVPYIYVYFEGVKQYFAVRDKEYYFVSFFDNFRKSK